MADDAADFESALADAGLAADVLGAATTDAVFEALCYDAVSCLVVPADAGSVDGRNAARGVAALYPGLPIVVAGGEAPDEADGHVVHVDAATVTAPAVVDAVADALAGGVESAAAREPSRAETLLMSVVDGFPMHLYAKDSEARHALATGATVDLNDVIGRTDLAFSDGPVDQHRRSHRDDRSVIETGEPVIETEEYTAGDDDEYAVTSKVPWYGADGEVVGLAGITQDISERKRRQKVLRRQNERLAKVALVAAHELRNELQVASGRLETLPDDLDGVDAVQRSHARLASIVDDVVALASQEHVETDERTVWLSTLAREVWEDFDAPDAELVVRGDARIRAQPESLRILFEILLSNALDHGGRDVTVTLGDSEDGFYVADDGRGIDVDPPDRVFDAGFAGSEEGDGFGLYVAQRIAADHGWELHAENGPDGGARFVVSGVERPDEA